MRYEKPEVMEIGARPAAGQEPENCISGMAAQGGMQSCVEGPLADWSCQVGNVPQPWITCAPGDAADTGGDCYSGTVVQNWCEAGTNGGQDTYGCTVGPSYT